MSVPVVGAGITVIVSRSSRYKWPDEKLLLRAYVTTVTEMRDGRIVAEWKSGYRRGEVVATDEYTTWIHGHGPQARAALRAARALSR